VSPAALTRLAAHVRRGARGRKSAER